MEQRSIALDGPAGAGKSTLAKKAAERFGLIYVDTGALYRCVGLYTLRKGVASTDENAVCALLPEIKLEMLYDSGGVQRMLLLGEDVTDLIRQPEVSKYASDVSAMPRVRAFLLNMQREMAAKYDVIMDGRDIATVVLPEAGLKVFLTADPRTRAYRRFLELKEKHSDMTLEEVLEEMINRDAKDSGRQISPLTVADDAIVLDTTELGLDESADVLCAMIKLRFGQHTGE